jgi:hypothetical protein
VNLRINNIGQPESEPVDIDWPDGLPIPRYNDHIVVNDQAVVVEAATFFQLPTGWVIGIDVRTARDQNGIRRFWPRPKPVR